MKKILIPVLIFVLLLQIVSAEIVVNKLTCDFSLESASIDRKVCACSNVDVPLLVDNVGDVEAIFDIKVLSEQEWFNVKDRSFKLLPGEAKNTVLTANIPCGFTGMVDYTVKVTTRSFGREREIHRSFEVVQCQNLDVEGPGSDVICPAELASSSFKVKNTANFQESYFIHIADYKDDVTLSENAFVLNPDEEKEVFVYARFPASKWGELEIPLKVIAENNNLERTFDMNVKIKRAYAHSVTLQESNLFVCNELGKTMLFNVKNNKVACDEHEGVDNTFHISLVNAPGFVELNLDKITLSPGEDQDVMITVPAGTAAGKKDITLLVESEFGGIVSQRNIELEVADCYDHRVDLDVPEICVICGQDEWLGLNVRNKGIFEEDLRVSMFAEDWVEMPNELVSVSPGETKTNGIKVNAPCADQTYILNVEAINNDVSGIVASASDELKVCTPRTAYMLELLQHNFDIWKESKAIEVPVRNIGFYEGSYNITLDSEFLTPEFDTFTIAPGETKYLRFLIGDLSDKELGEYLHGLVLTEMVMNVPYETSIGTNYLGMTAWGHFKAWFMKVFVNSEWYKKIGWCGWSGILLLLILVALVVFYILIKIGKLLVKRFRAGYRDHFKVLRVALIILCALALIFAVVSFNADRPQFFEQPKNDGPLTHEWFENNDYVLDLNKYFADPDQDNLRYDHEGIDHMQIIIKNGLAVISPDTDWSGEEKAIFVAIDEAGASAESRSFTLRVLGKRDNLTWFDYWKANCSEVNAFIIGLIFLALLLLLETCRPWTKEELQKRRKAAQRRRARKQAARKRARKRTRRRKR